MCVADRIAYGEGEKTLLGIDLETGQREVLCSKLDSASYANGRIYASFQDRARGKVHRIFDVRTRAYRDTDLPVGGGTVSPDQWVPFDSYVQDVQLTPTEGSKLLYAQFLDRDTLPSGSLELETILDSINNPGTPTEGYLGQVSDGEYASIILDKSSPLIISANCVPHSSYASNYYTRQGGLLKGTWDGTDAYSGVASYEYRIMEVTSNGAVPEVRKDWTEVPEEMINRFNDKSAV